MTTRRVPNALGGCAPAKRSIESRRRAKQRIQRHHVATPCAVSMPNVEPSRFAPLETMSQVAAQVAKFVQDALIMIQKLFQSVVRVRIAAAAIASLSRDEKSVSAPPESSNKDLGLPLQAPPGFQENSSKGKDAPKFATSLQHTLNDVTGTLDAKWKALESSLESRAGSLFSATQKSATALQSIQGGSAATLRMWSLETTASVLKHEEELRQQVFEKVLAELEGRDHGRSKGLAY